MWSDPKLAIGAIPLADLDSDPALVEQLSLRQWVKSVTLI